MERGGTVRGREGQKGKRGEGVLDLAICAGPASS